MSEIIDFTVEDYSVQQLIFKGIGHAVIMCTGFFQFVNYMCQISIVLHCILQEAERVAAKADTFKFFDHVLWCIVRDNTIQYVEKVCSSNLDEVEHRSGLPLSTKTQSKDYILPACDKK